MGTILAPPSETVTPQISENTTMEVSQTVPKYHLRGSVDDSRTIPIRMKQQHDMSLLKYDMTSRLLLRTLQAEQNNKDGQSRFDIPNIRSVMENRGFGQKEIEPITPTAELVRTTKTDLNGTSRITGAADGQFGLDTTVKKLDKINFAKEEKSIDRPTTVDENKIEMDKETT